MSASTSPQPHFVLALESVICWTLHGWLCKPGGALLLHNAETKDDRTPTGSSVIIIILLLCFTTQVVEARGEEREKKVKYIDCADGLKA